MCHTTILIPIVLAEFRRHKVQRDMFRGVGLLLDEIAQRTQRTQRMAAEGAEALR
jgi:hypothetical protein